MSIAAYLAKLSEGVNSSGILATSKGGTGTTSGGAFPTIASISYGGDENDTATDTNGGRTVTITGANFVANAKILINGVMAPVVTVVSASTITFTTPAMAAGTYVLYMVQYLAFLIAEYLFGQRPQVLLLLLLKPWQLADH